MRYLALDPSSTCCGYAACDGPRLLDAGRLRPAKARADANTRIRDIAAQLRALLAEVRPECVVIEDTSGHVARRISKWNVSGLATYGKAIGVVWAVCEQIVPAPPVLVDENQWTRGVSKAVRQGWIMRTVPEYKAASDPGGDVADAIGLARWWWERRRLAELAK